MKAAGLYGSWGVRGRRPYRFDARLKSKSPPISGGLLGVTINFYGLAGALFGVSANDAFNAVN